MDLVGMNDGVSFLVDADYFAFAWVKGHHPLAFPILESI